MDFLKNYPKRYDLRYLSGFYSFCSWLAIVPTFNFNSTRSKQSNKHWWPMFIGLGLLTWYLIAMRFRVVVRYPDFKAVEQILDFSTLFVSTVASLYMSFNIYVSNSNNLHKLLKNIMKIDKEISTTVESHLMVDLSTKVFNWSYHLEIAGVYGLFVTLFFYNFYVIYIVMSGLERVSIWYRDIQQVHVITIALLFNNLAVVLFYRFRTFNRLLAEKITMYYTASKDMGSISVVKPRSDGIYKNNNADEIVYFMRKYCMLGDCVKILNKSVGYPMICISISIVLGFLRPLQTICSFGNAKIPLLYLLWNASIVFRTVVLGLLAVPSYHILAREAQRTANICYTMLKKYAPLLPSQAEDKKFREHLFLLGLYASKRCPRVTAAGYYDVDYSMLLMIFGSITSYFIVLIQLN